MGILWSSRYDPDREIGDQTGRVFLITGANSGLGYETTRRLAAHGATIYLACRSRQRAENAIAQIESELPHIAGARRLRFLQVDLSNLRSVISAADEFMQREAHLHVLIHNAARMPSPYELSPDGVEMHIAVNYLAAAVLTDALSPVLEATARIPNADVRILALSSGMYSWIPAAAKFDTVEDWNMYGGSIGDDLFSGYERYGTSKTMCILWASHLQRAFDRERLPITAVSLHPGFSRTESALDQAPRWFRPLFFLVTLSVEQGAHTTLFAATSQELWRRRDHFKGKYLEPFGKITRPSVECARDRGRAQILWDATKRISASILST